MATKKPVKSDNSPQKRQKIRVGPFKTEEDRKKYLLRLLRNLEQGGDVKVYHELHSIAMDIMKITEVSLLKREIEELRQRIEKLERSNGRS